MLLIASDNGALHYFYAIPFAPQTPAASRCQQPRQCQCILPEVGQRGDNPDMLRLPGG